MKTRFPYLFAVALLFVSCTTAPMTIPEPLEESPTEQVTQGVKLYLVDLAGTPGTDGAAKEIGCGDHLVSITREITTDDSSIPAAVVTSLNTLFDITLDEAQAEGHHTVFGDMDIRAVGASIKERVLYVELFGSPTFGGVCDTPRFFGQIEETIRQFSGFTDLVIRLNGSAELYTELGSGQG